MSHSKVPHLTHSPFTYERQPQHRDHPTGEQHMTNTEKLFFYVGHTVQNGKRVLSLVGTNYVHEKKEIL